ncbi:MAG TPA: hypothetical protein VGV63_04870 [Acidimicrobiales bacterium]|nr:hypothetical protein [Acidimicrobiales bacterium]
MVLGACGDDDDDGTATGEASTTAETTDTTDATSAEQVDTEEYCTQLLDFQTFISSGPEGGEDEGGGGEEQTGAAGEGETTEYPAAGDAEEPVEGDGGGPPLPEAFVTEAEERLEELEAGAPEAIADDVSTAAGKIRDALQTGDDPFGDPEFMEASDNVDSWMLDECGYEEHEITAVDYAFQGVPDELSSGEPVALRLTNEGSEVHEMVVFRLLDETMSLEELLELPEEEGRAKAAFVSATMAEPGQERVAFAELEPGRYGMVCFIPLGTTELPEGPQGGDENGGAPHFTQGMHTEFTVD